MHKATAPVPTLQSEPDSYLSTDLGEGGRQAAGLHARDLKPHNSLALRAPGLKAAVLEAGPESTVGAAEAGLVQGQDGPIITALLQGVVDLVPTPGRRLAHPLFSIWRSPSRMGSKSSLRHLGLPRPVHSILFLPGTPCECEHRSPKTKTATERQKGDENNAGE